jgi:hypothetical protein
LVAQLLNMGGADGCSADDRRVRHDQRI